MPAYDATIRLPEKGRIVQFREFLDFSRRLERVSPGSRVLLDLERVEFAHASGMAPIIAVMHALVDRGWHFDIALPKNDFLCDYFFKAGWEAGILGERAPSTLPGNSFIPLTRYASSTELNPVLAEAINHFARHSVFESGVLEGIEWAVNEVADNVLNHAGGVPGWLQLAEQPKKGLIEIVVADCGIGICASLRERYPGLKSDIDAISLAAEKGVTRNQEIGQGNGLAGTLRIAIAANGWVNIHSGNGLLRYTPEGGPVRREQAASDLTLADGPYHGGTVVTLTLPINRKIDVTTALWGSRPVSTFEMPYLSDDGNFVVFDLAQEGSGFGNRESARPLRQKVRNLLNLYPSQRLVISFENVNVASSSFLDELVARLAKEMGVATFFHRIVLANMNDLIRRTLDEVMEQRLGK